MAIHFRKPRRNVRRRSHGTVSVEGESDYTALEFDGVYYTPCKLLCSFFLRRHCIEVTCETHKCVCSVPLTRYASNEREISCAIGLDHSYVCLSPEKSFSQMAWQLCSNSAFDEVLKANWGCGWKRQKQ